MAPLGDVAQLARAPALQAGSRGFESHRLHRESPGQSPATGPPIGLGSQIGHNLRAGRGFPDAASAVSGDTIWDGVPRPCVRRVGLSSGWSDASASSVEGAACRCRMRVSGLPQARVPGLSRSARPESPSAVSISSPTTSRTSSSLRFLTSETLAVRSKRGSPSHHPAGAGRSADIAPVRHTHLRRSASCHGTGRRQPLI